MATKKTTTKRKTVKKSTPKAKGVDSIEQIKKIIPKYRCYGCGEFLDIDDMSVFNGHRGYHLVCAKRRYGSSYMGSL